MTSNKKIRVCVAGATGWAGSELCRGIVSTKDLELVSAVSRTNANKDLNELLNLSSKQKIPVFGTIEEALTIPCDVLVDYTKPDIAKHQIITAIHKGVNVVVGTSGLSDADYEDIKLIAEQKKQAVLAVGNFAISVVLLNKFAEMAARFMPQWEIIDYASDKKIDSPSGSALELAHRLSKVRESVKTIPIEETKGVKGTRGADINGMQVHAVRLPGFIISLETIFGMTDEKLIIKHEAGGSAKPYVQGALLAIRKVDSFIGLKRGLDNIMDFN
ncbi:4-hydroxy-tetrahydrodipicolinate reductase [Pedobacter sp. PAMC26386]|nr:4-hydroxy-tetrahydrodipicolinate reductase [Pedobacter sp. PAMC26386]